MLRRALPFILILLVIAALIGGQAARQQAGIEVSVESVRAWVDSLGWYGPAIYLGLVALRIFFLLPSWVVLSAGGLVFGLVEGTLLGGVGIVLSACLSFAISRGVARDWLGPRMAARSPGMQERIERVGPLVIAVVNAHPVGPMSATHVAAGATPLSPLRFLGAVSIGGPIRAFLLSLFGASLIDPGSSEFVMATGVLIAAAVLPLAHPGFRRMLFLRGATDGDS